MLVQKLVVIPKIVPWKSLFTPYRIDTRKMSSTMHYPSMGVGQKFPNAS